MPTPPTSSPGRWLTTPRFAIGLAILIAIFFPALLFGGKTFVFRDFGIFTLPNAAFQRECFWRGEIPLWNPFNNCGIPFLAQWNMAALYPLSLVYLLLPLVPGLNLFCLGHLLLAGIGMYCLAFNWTQNRLGAAVAGTAFTFSGMTLNCLMWTSNLAALAWMPWVVLAVEYAGQHGGRRTVIAGLAGAMQMLTGGAEIIIFTWFILCGLLALKLAVRPGNRFRVLTRMVIAGGLAALLSAAQLLPFLDLLAHSERNSGYSNGAWSIPLWGWANLFVPLYHCYEQPLGVFFQSDQSWTSSYYPGIGVLVLAILALVIVRQPKTWLLAGLAGLGFWLAMGNSGLLYSGLAKIFPALGFMRYPVKFAFLMTFSLPLLAAYAVAAFDEARGEASVLKRFWLTGVLIGMCAVIIGGLLWHADVHPFPAQQWPALWHTGVLRMVFLVLIPGLAWLSGTRPLPLAGWLLPMLIFADVATDGPPQNPVVDASVYQPGLLAQYLSPLPQLGEARAFIPQVVDKLFYHWELKNVQEDYIGRRCSLMGDCNLLDDVPVTEGFYPLHIREQLLLYYEFAESSPTNITANGLADFLAISTVSDPHKLLNWRMRPSHLPVYSVGAKPEFLALSDTPGRLL